MRFLTKPNKYGLTDPLLGVIISLTVVLILSFITNSFAQLEQQTKLWERISGLIAMVLITTLIVWMIANRDHLTTSIKSQAALKLSSGGILGLSAMMIAREGVEITLFSIAGSYSTLSLFTGIVLALLLTILIYYSLIKIDLKLIFKVTFIYLILQAGFLIGYSIHEGLEAFNAMGYISNSPLLIKAFDFKDTIIDHKTGLIGLPLYVLGGWHSRPEIIQLIIQYTYTGILLFLYFKKPKLNQQ